MPTVDVDCTVTLSRSMGGLKMGNVTVPRTMRNARRDAVAAASPASMPAAIPSHPKSAATIALIETAVQGSMLFHGTPHAQLMAIIDTMHPVSIDYGTEIIVQGDRNATEFYVLESGAAEVYRMEPGALAARKVAAYGPGSAFGDLALLHHAPRAATVRATASCRLWAMQRDVYRSIKGSLAQQASSERSRLLQGVPMLSRLSHHHRAMLADAMEMVTFLPGQYIYSKGDPGDLFYVIREGGARSMDAGSVVATYAAGGSFGEVSLMREEVRGVDMISEGHTVCYTLSRARFNELLGPFEDVWRFEALRKVPLLHNLTEPQLWRLARAMLTAEFAKGDLVFKKGERGDKFYVIEDGVFSCFDDGGREVARVGRGSCFGELALLRRDCRALNVMALADAKVLTLHRDQFTALLGSLEAIRNMWRFEAVKRVPLFSALPHGHKHRIAAALNQLQLPAGAMAVKEGAEADAFYVIESGQCVVYNSGREDEPLMTLKPGAYFGELGLLHDERRAANVRAISDVGLLSLSKSAFQELMGPLLAQLEERAAAYARIVRGYSKTGRALEMKDTTTLAQLGVGGFGRVSLVRWCGKPYALKTMSKAFVVESKLVESVNREKEAMRDCDGCPWLVGLVATASDDTSLHMLLEPVMGGEFFTHLTSRESPLSERDARFYAACVVCALEALHTRGYVYRDLKPENLLLDSQGYLKLADFGFAKKLKLGSKTYTLCGTPEYLAPEVIMNEGHSFAADWWSLGVLMFEMCAGLPPFYNEDRLAMYRAAVQVQYKFPPHFSRELRELLGRLLVRQPSQRVGSWTGSIDEIKRHRWFKDFDWESFNGRRMPAPHAPVLKGHEDASNFAPAAEDESAKACRSKRYKSEGRFTDF